MKRIKQINESKQLILDGFMKLLSERPLNEITISEIAEEAGVTRLTVYRHFADKENIIIFSFEQNLQSAIDTLKGKKNPTLIDLLEFRFRMLKNSPYTQILANHKKLNKLFQTIGIHFSHHFTDVIPIVKDKHIKTFIAGGVDSVTEMWINNGMTETPEYMAGRISDLLKSLLSQTEDSFDIDSEIDKEYALDEVI